MQHGHSKVEIDEGVFPFGVGVAEEGAAVDTALDGDQGLLVVDRRLRAFAELSTSRTWKWHLWARPASALRAPRISLAESWPMALLQAYFLGSLVPLGAAASPSGMQPKGVSALALVPYKKAYAQCNACGVLKRLSVCGWDERIMSKRILLLDLSMILGVRGCLMFAPRMQCMLHAADLQIERCTRAAKGLTTAEDLSAREQSNLTRTSCNARSYPLFWTQAEGVHVRAWVSSSRCISSCLQHVRDACEGDIGHRSYQNVVGKMSRMLYMPFDD